jgi:membrane protein implicated in regulation of membrane protease activity
MLWGVLHFLMAYWQWIGIALIVSAGLGYAAFILRNWKLAAVAVGLLVLFFSHQWTYVAGSNARLRLVQAESARLLKARDETIKDVQEAATKQAAEDAKRIAELEKKIDATPKNNRPALPRAAAGRVRDIR